MTPSALQFAWIGATAVALWGNTAPGAGADSVFPPGYGSDGSNGDQPRYNRIDHNLCRELGIYEKQSSFYTQFKAGYNLVDHNIVYNGPRAHLNHNDGFAGGTVHDGNLIFNSCRESGDHGPFKCVCTVNGPQCARARPRLTRRARPRARLLLFPLLATQLVGPRPVAHH